MSFIWLWIHAKISIGLKWHIFTSGLATWSWDRLECCSCSFSGDVYLLVRLFEFSNLGPALFLFMANLKAFSETVKFSDFLNFSHVPHFLDSHYLSNSHYFLDFRFSGISYFLKLPDFHNYLVFQNCFKGL